MTYLLDTHVVLWWLTDDPTLPSDVATTLDDEPDVFISAVNVWEVAIKHALGKLSGPADLAERVRDSGFRELAVTSDHAITAARLPLLHRDPFDRILIAQACLHGLTLVTRDPMIPKYAVRVLPA
jgi:PIN domain nuclease of toxin-antitoxin system